MASQFTRCCAVARGKRFLFTQLPTSISTTTQPHKAYLKTSTSSAPSHSWKNHKSYIPILNKSINMSSTVLADRDVNAAAAQQPTGETTKGDVKSMEYHRQVLQSKLEESKYGLPPI